MNVDELIGRMSEKEATLKEMASEKDPNDEIERARLSGKAEGVNLALSFLREYAHEAREQELEMMRHHRDFKRISDILDRIQKAREIPPGSSLVDTMSVVVTMTSGLAEIRGIVG